MFDVICVGSATVDTFVRTKYSELIKIIDQKRELNLLAYPTGSKILIEGIDFTTGGGGTNVSVALSKLGLKASYLGCIGNDGNGNLVIEELKKNNVDTSLIIRKKGQTGYSVILDSIEHDRTILTFKGVNNKLSLYDIDKKKLKTNWFYFSSMLDKAFNTLENIARYASKSGIKIAFNASSYLAEKGSSYLKNILSNTEMLILNKEEAELLVGKDSIQFLCKKIHELGPKYVVITDGKFGAYCYHKNILYYAKTNKIKVVETTGAGDAFASSFLAGILLKDDIPFAMKLATTNAESVISHHGAKNKLLKLKEAKNIMAYNHVRISKRNI